MLLQNQEWFVTGNYKAQEIEVWSLGTLLYTLVSNEIPYQKPNDIFLSPLKWQSEVEYSTRIKDLISRCLAIDSIERIKLDQIGLHPWIRDVENT